MNREQLERVQGRLGFVEDAPAAAGELAYGVAQTSREVTVRNARPIQHELSLDAEGFVLARHETAFAHERDPQVISTKYVDELVPFIKDYFRASSVIPRSDAVCVRNAG